MIEHQRTSYLDNRAIDTAKIEPYDGHVTLYMADRYPRRRDHVRAALLNPQTGRRLLGRVRQRPEVVPIGGEYIQAIDEPYIARWARI